MPSTGWERLSHPMSSWNRWGAETGAVATRNGPPKRVAIYGWVVKKENTKKTHWGQQQKWLEDV